MGSNEYPSDNFFHVNEVTLIISGIKLPSKYTKMERFIYIVYVIGLYSTAIIFFFCEILRLGDTIIEPTKFISHIGLLFTHVVGILKFCILAFGYDEIQKIMNILQETKYQYKSLGDFQPGLLISKAKKRSTGFSIMVFVLYTLVGVSAHLSSYITINRKVKGLYFEGFTTCYDFLPYYFYIPFATDTKTQCGYAFVFMDVALGVFAWCIACYDGIFCGLLNYLKTQLLILGEALKTIRLRCEHRLNIPKDCIIFRDEDCPELENELYKELNHCIKHLMLLLQANEKIERIFTYTTLAQTVASILIFSSCLFVATTVSITSPEFFAQAEYFMCVLIQLSLICWHGSEITVSSQLINRSLYESDWYSSSLRFKRALIMIMCRMQHPVYLSIGKFTTLGLTTLMAVIRGSFSYFAVFNSMK